MNLGSYVILFFIIFPFICSIYNESLKESQFKELENIFDNYLLNNDNKMNLLLKSKKDKDLSDEQKCSYCTNIFVNVNEYFLSKNNDYQYIYNFGKMVCSYIYDSDSCISIINEYGPIVMKNFVELLNNTNRFCSVLNLCKNQQNDNNFENWAENLLKNKPSKKRENINFNKNNIYNMIQITDIHYDPKYLEGADTKCKKPLCCREKSNKDTIKSGKYGFCGNCDINDNLINSAFDSISQLNPDFIIWTGDMGPHDLWDSSQENIYNITKYLLNLYDKKLGKIPLFPILGNHEKFPNDEFTLVEDSTLLQTFADIYKPYLDEEAYQSFSKYGYYSQKYLNTNLRIIGLNCLICDTFNFNLLNDKKLPKQQFDWLENILISAEKNNEFVYILDHIPINANFYLSECAKRMQVLLDRFEYIIRGYFSGHTHFDDIAIVTTYKDKIPNIINYIAPALTTFPSIYPSYRNYIIDKQTMQIFNYEQYRLNVTQANIDNQANWYISHNANNFFNVNDMTEVNKLYEYVVGNDYMIKRYADAPKGYDLSKKEKIVKEAQCTIKEFSYENWMKCSHPSFDLDQSQLFNILNKLGGYWE